MAHAIDQLFNTLISKNGSDLHLEEGQKPKIRIHGTLVEIGDEPLTHEKMVALLSPIPLKEDWQRFETHGDLDFAYAFGHRPNREWKIHNLGSNYRLYQCQFCQENYHH